MPVKVIESLPEFYQIINKDRPAVVDFWATWCGPCKAIAPVFDRLSEEMTNVDFYKVDVDDQEDVAQEAGVRMMPTFLVFKGGIKVDSTMGADPQALSTLITKYNEA